MKHLFLETITFLEEALAHLEGQVPAPKWTLVNEKRVVRYKEQTPQQALVQKFARAISGLKALELLLSNGLAQEQGVIKRVLDEIHEDTLFISHAIITDEWTPRHEEYLKDFWAEEFDHPDPLKATQLRVQVPRKKIRAANARLLSDNPHDTAENERTLYNAYSGYVHANSSAVMEMCGGQPPRFMIQVPASDAYTKVLAGDAWNYFFRTLIAAGMVAKAFGDDALGIDVYNVMYRFEDASGRKYSDEFRDK